MSNWKIHILSIAQIIFCLIGCLKFPGWVRDGYLYDWYPLIGTAVACYGGFIGGLIWYIIFIKINK